LHTPGFNHKGLSMGVLAALLSACASSAKDLVSKALAARVSPDLSTFASFLFALPFYAAILTALCLAGGEQLIVSREFLILVFLRGLTDVFAEGFKMRAFAVGDVSLVSGLLSLSPLILAGISPFLTGDRVRSSEVVGIAVIVFGGLVLIKRDDKTGGLAQWAAILYAIGASFAFAINSCFDRIAVGHAGPVTSAFSMTLCAALLAVPTLRRISSVGIALRSNASSFLIRGFFETLFMVAKMVALVHLPAHVVLGLTRMAMLITVAIGGAWFQEQDRLRRIIGTIIMYAGLLILVL